MKQILRCWVVLLSMFFYQTTFAQDKLITGTITSSEDGSAMPGVSISVKGSSKGTTTDGNGKYKLSAPQNGALVFSFLGYKTKEVSAGNQSTINITLEEDAAALDEVVVTGVFDTRTKMNASVAISTLNLKQIGGHLHTYTILQAGLSLL